MQDPKNRAIRAVRHARAALDSAEKHLLQIKSNPQDRWRDYLACVSVDEATQVLVTNTLRAVNGSRARAASLLGIGERTLYRLLRTYRNQPAKEATS